MQDLLLVPLQLLDEMLEIADWLENSKAFDIAFLGMRRFFQTTRSNKTE